MITHTTWHEAGHAVFANVFKDFLRIKEVSIIPQENRNGGVLIETQESDGPIFDSFHFVIVSIAGLVVEFMNPDRGNETLRHNIVKYLNKRVSPGDDTADAFDGDFENMMPWVNYLSESLNIGNDKVVMTAAIFIFQCLSHPDFWPTIDKTVEELHARKSLSYQDTQRIFDECGYNAYVAKHKRDFIEVSRSLLKMAQED
jgi:hypothetical protein